nr:CPBP family glutamic-type intramembrane protease [uncultured Janthinobacterium sp.]
MCWRSRPSSSSAPPCCWPFPGRCRCCACSCTSCFSCWRSALVSGLLFGLCHAFLATSVTQVGAPIVVFTVIEGLVAGLVYCRAGLLAAGWV